MIYIKVFKCRTDVKVILFLSNSFFLTSALKINLGQLFSLLECQHLFGREYLRNDINGHCVNTRNVDKQHCWLNP